MNSLSKISLFANYFEIIPKKEETIQNFCLNIIDGDFKEEIEALRKNEDKEIRDKIKATLPAVTISGVFSSRSNEALIHHSGFICLDFDMKGNPEINDWPALRNSLSDIENIYFASLSVSGKGIFLIIPILKPDQHREHFIALEKDFKNHLGLTIDKACKDISRLRGISYDPEAIINESAEPYRRIYEKPIKIIKHTLHQMTKP